MHAANQLIVVDLLAALEAGREPLSSGHDARAALEMIMAVYWSHIRAQRVPLPLAERGHPLRTGTRASGRWTGASRTGSPRGPGGERPAARQGPGQPGVEPLRSIHVGVGTRGASHLRAALESG